MAEGIDPLKDGSDADFEIICTPCREDNIREEAVKFCPKCQEYLCTSCSRHHGRLKATRLHKLLAKDDVTIGSVVAKTKCRYHPDRDIEMYCGTHDMVYCTMCIVTEHRSCQGINKTEDEFKSCVQETEIQSLFGELTIVRDSMKILVVKKQANLSSLEKQMNALQEKVEEVESSLIGHIRKLKSNMIDSLNNDYANIKSDVQSEARAANHMIQNLEESSHQLQTVSSMQAAQQFVQMKLIKKTVNEAKTLHANNASSDTKTFTFMENTDLVTSVMATDALGTVLTDNRDKKSTQYKMKSQKEINVKVKSDKPTCTISDICKLPDGMILLADQDNNKIKRLDVNYKIKDHFYLDAIPTGICCLDKNEIAVKLNNNKIQFLTVGSSLSKTRCITIVDGKYYGIAYCAGELWISTGNSVTVYNIAGNLIKVIDKDQNDIAIFKSITQHMTSHEDHIIVTDWSAGAVSLYKNGSIKSLFRDTRLKGICGTCVSNDGTVFICGNVSNNILMFSRDGKCLGELVGADSGSKKPISMCFDENSHCLIIARDGADAIDIVNLFK